MKLLILSRAPYDGDRTKTCSNDRTEDTQRLEDASPNKCENTQQTNQQVPTSHTDGLSELTSRTGSRINYSPTVYSAANDSHNMQSHDKMYQETQPTPFTGDASDSLPLDLSGFPKTSSASQFYPTESCRNSESPLDLSVKTRKTIADSTYVNSFNNVAVSGEAQFYRNFENSEIYQKVEKRNEAILGNTQIHKKVKNNAPYMRNGFQCYPDGHLLKADHKNLISHYPPNQVQSSNSNTAVLSSSDRSSQKQLHFSQQSNPIIVPSLHHHHSSEVSHCSVNKMDNSRNTPGLQKYGFSGQHSLGVSPHPFLTPSPSLPSSPHSASASPYLVPSSPRGYFSVPASPRFSSAPNNTGLSNRISVLQEAEKRIGELDYGRSRVIQSNVPLTKPSVLRQLNARTPPLYSQSPFSVDAQLPVNVDKICSINKSPNNLYSTQTPSHYVGETGRSTKDVTPFAETERSSRNLSPPESRSPPTLSMVSPVIKPGNEAHESPMPVLSPHNTNAPGKTSAPPPLISFNTQQKPMYNNTNHTSSTQFESYRQYYTVDNNKTSALRGGHNGYKNVESLHLEYAYDDRIGQKRKDTTGTKGAEQRLLDSKGRTLNLTNHFRTNPFQQRILAQYSETYRQQLMLRGVRAQDRSPPNSGPEPRPPATENRYSVNRLGDSSLLQSKRKYRNDATNISPDSNTVPTPSRSRFQMKNDNTSSLMKTTENILKYFSQENVHWKQPKVNTDRQINMKQSSVSTADIGASVSDTVNQCRKPALDVKNPKPAEKFIGSLFPNDNGSGRAASQDENLKTDIGNLFLPLMIYGQVLLSGSTSNTNQQHSDTLHRETTVTSVSTKVNSANDWNNTTIDLTECDLDNSEKADISNRSEDNSAICSSRHIVNNPDHNFDHDTKKGTEDNGSSASMDSCKHFNGNLESMSFRKTTDQISEVKENDQNRVEKKPDDSSTLSTSANDGSFADHSEEFPANDTVKSKYPFDSADNLAPQDNLPSSEAELSKTEQPILESKLNKASHMPMTIFCQSLQPKSNLLNGRLSVKCSSEYKEMCPLMKKVSLSLEKEMQRRTTGIHSRALMSTSKTIQNESENIHNNITLTGDVHVDAKMNMENHDAFDFCESENEDSQSGRPRFQSIKRFAGRKRASHEISGKNESDENSNQRRCRLTNREESPISERTKPVPKCDPKQKKRKKFDVYQQIKAVGRRKRKCQTKKTFDPKQKKRKKLDVYQQIKAVGRRKRKYQTKKTILRCRQNNPAERASSGERLDGRRPRKRYHKNEAYEEELAREEHRKAMLRAKRRQRQQEHDKPDDVTLCAKRRQGQQEDDKTSTCICDVTLCNKRRQQQQEHDKTSLCPDDVITSKSSLENLEAENIVHNRIDPLPRRRVGRPPKNIKKCNIKNEIKERRPVGRPRKSTSKKSLISKCQSQLAQKSIKEERIVFRSLHKNDTNQDFYKTANCLDFDSQIDQLLGNENITQEGVSDNIFHLPSYIKDENKDDSDFADDATVIYDISDSPEVPHSEDGIRGLSGIRSFPPDLKRLQVNKNVGETVLHRAARLGYEDVIVYCLETGLIDVNVKDHGGYTALHECCVRGNLDVAKRLIAYGANVNSSALDGTRPVHDAVACNRVEMVRLLLSSGADPTLATYSGRTCAKIAHTKEMKEFLRGYESDLNDGDAEEVCWDFHSSSIFESTGDLGFDIFEDVPADDDVINIEPHFDSSSRPPLRAYTLELEENQGPTNYHLLNDVLENMQMNRNEFFNLCGNVSIVTVTCDVINRQFEHNQLLLSPWQHNLLSGNNANRSIQYIELVRLDDNLRKHLCITKDILSSACDLPNDSIVSSATDSDLTSGDLYPMMQNQSRDSYLFAVSNFLDTPEKESEFILERKSSQVTNKSLSKETPHICPMDFTSPDGDESQMSSVRLTTTTQTFSHTGGNNTASISPMKGSTLKLANTTRGCFGDPNVSGSNNPTSDRHRSSPATGEDACTLKVAQECMMRDSIIGNEFQAQQTTHSTQHNPKQQIQKGYG